MFGYVRLQEHRLIIMRKLGRILKSWEHVHRGNGIKTDNREENLQLMESNQHFTVTKLIAENKKLEQRIFTLEEEVRNLKVKQILQEKI